MKGKLPKDELRENINNNSKTDPVSLGLKD